jgi:hypothetical protein
MRPVCAKEYPTPPPLFSHAHEKNSVMPKKAKMTYQNKQLMSHLRRPRGGKMMTKSGVSEKTIGCTVYVGTWGLSLSSRQNSPGACRSFGSSCRYLATSGSQVGMETA